MSDFLFLDDLTNTDPALAQLCELEAERQKRKLIMIPSESTAPRAVREALGSAFTNIYAEGYPRDETRKLSEAEITHYGKQLGVYRRLSDPRYYKGVEYVDVVEALARRRCAEAFAANGLSADELFVNVQPLSGAPANNAVYTAMLTPGDSILGMNLLHGGHLTHGSPVNRSGLVFNAAHYTVDDGTEKIDYESLALQAQQVKPKIIIAGYSSYPWIPDWKKFREIADSVGAYFLADVSHIAGLIAAGLVASPIGYAHFVTFTTHKTLCGPRGAVIITTDESLSAKIDKAVFPGEQGGPHINNIAAMAVSFKLAQTAAFKSLQAQTLKNAAAFADQLMKRGMRVPYKGTDSHITLIDCKVVKGVNGVALTGDLGARLLDLVGIVANRNTIPGDASAFKASGVRFGSTWLTQRGLKEADMRIVADVIADVLFATTPYPVATRTGFKVRAKVDFKVFEAAKIRIRDMAEKLQSCDDIQEKHTYPHFYYLDDKQPGDFAGFEISGDKARNFVYYTFANDVEALQAGKSQAGSLHTSEGSVVGQLSCISPDCFRFTVAASSAGLAGAWLRNLSDAYTRFDDDLLIRIPGPVCINDCRPEAITVSLADVKEANKPYFIGKQAHTNQPALPDFSWQDQDSDKILKTALNQVHHDLGAKMIPFAGWELPVWYSSVLEEHEATRKAAGLFDVTHMGVFQVEGADACLFLDGVCANDITMLSVGESLYTHFLDPDANVLDDLLVYYRSPLKYLVVVNAANEAKDWAWLNAVKAGTVQVDRRHPAAQAPGKNCTLRNLKDPSAGKDMRVDVALQGPKSRQILLSLPCSDADRKRIMALKRTDLCEATVDGIDLVVSRTGYTGEKMCFELFVHPDQAVKLWHGLMKAGESYGLKPCGLGARDSLRTEAGLPLYGHEMGGMLNLGVSEANFGLFVKTSKPWFIGRDAYIKRDAARTSVVVRFRFNDKAVRMAHLGDPVLNDKGICIGVVTSCAIDQEGFLTGQAYIDQKFSKDGNAIYIYQSASDKALTPTAALKKGEKVTLPSQATVISRFMR